jgi:predicted Ser/Thr protein kinase
MIGKTIGKYRITEKLGAGGMGTVYRAIQISLDRPVAFKVLLPQMAQDEEFINRFTREAKILAHLDHENIVRIYDFETEGDMYYIAMEFIDGPNLGNLLKQHGPLKPQLWLKVARSVASALSAAHTRGIIHRDIKPDNIMFTNDGRVKVADFGIARVEESAQWGEMAKRTQTYVRLGSPAYMSPEQIKGEKITSGSDIFSWGITLYEAATGQSPYRAKTFRELEDEILKGSVIPPTQLNPALPKNIEQIILKAMATRPNERFGSAQELEKELRTTEWRKLDEKLFCPNCDAVIKSGQSKCTQCLKPLTMLCACCDRPIKENTKVCPYCGAVVAAPKEEVPTKKTSVLPRGLKPKETAAVATQPEGIEVIEGAAGVEVIERQAPKIPWKIIIGAGGVVVLGILLAVFIPKLSKKPMPTESLAARGYSGGGGTPPQVQLPPSVESIPRVPPPPPDTHQRLRKDSVKVKKDTVRVITESEKDKAEKAIRAIIEHQRSATEREDIQGLLVDVIPSLHSKAIQKSQKLFNEYDQIQSTVSIKSITVSDDNQKANASYHDIMTGIRKGGTKRETLVNKACSFKFANLNGIWKITSF